MTSSVLISEFKPNLVSTSSQTITKLKPKKFVPLIFRCKWDGKELQVTTHKHEKKLKDYCGAYCNRAYYDLIKRLNLQFESTNAILSTPKGTLLREKIVTKLEKNCSGEEANKDLIEGAKKIKKDRQMMHIFILQIMENIYIAKKKQLIIKKNESIFKSKMKNT